MISGIHPVRSCFCYTPRDRAAQPYVVPASGIKSGNPYVERYNKPNPAKTRRSNDGRDRSQATKTKSHLDEETKIEEFWKWFSGVAPSLAFDVENSSLLEDS